MSTMYQSTKELRIADLLAKEIPGLTIEKDEEGDLVISDGRNTLFAHRTIPVHFARYGATYVAEIIAAIEKAHGTELVSEHDPGYRSLCGRLGGLEGVDS